MPNENGTISSAAAPGLVTGPESSDARQGAFERVLLGGILVFLIVRFAAFALGLAFMLPLRIDLTFPEGAVVGRAIDVARGGSAYRDWREWPHAFAPYGPLAYYPVGWTASAIWDGPDPWEVYWTGRALSVAALCAIVVLVFLIGSSLGLGWGWAAGAICLAASWDEVFRYAVSYRPDAPALAFSLAALVFMLRHPPSGRSLPVVFGLLSCAMWFKPTAWGMIVASCAWAQGAGRWRGFVCLGAFGLVNFVAAAILNFWLDGRLFLNMIGSLDNGFDPLRGLVLYKLLTRETLGVFLLGAAGLLGIVRGVSGGIGKDPRSRARSLFVLVAGASWAASMVLASKDGADVNYHLEPFILFALAAVCGVHDLLCGARGTRRVLIGLLICSVLAAWTAWGAFSGLRGYRAYVGGLRDSWGPTPIEQFVRARVQGDYFTTAPFIALVSPDQPAVLDVFQFEILARRGKLDPRSLLDRLSRAEFEVVILSGDDKNTRREDFVCAGFRQTLAAKYQPDRAVGAHVILKRRMKFGR